MSKRSIIIDAKRHPDDTFRNFWDTPKNLAKKKRRRPCECPLHFFDDHLTKIIGESKKKKNWWVNDQPKDEKEHFFFWLTCIKFRPYIGLPSTVKHNKNHGKMKFAHGFISVGTWNGTPVKDFFLAFWNALNGPWQPPIIPHKSGLPRGGGNVVTQTGKNGPRRVSFCLGDNVFEIWERSAPT